MHQYTHFKPSTIQIGSGVTAVGDGKNKKGREGRKRYYKNAQKCYISHPCREGPNDAIFTKFGTVVDLIYVMTYANFGCNRLKGETLRLYKLYLFPMISMVGLTTGKH